MSGPTRSKLERKFRKLLFWFELSVICAGLVLGPIANALQLQLSQDLTVRDSAENSTLKRVGLLKAGSVVDIPDQYKMEDSSGKISPELTLNNWLAKAGFDQKYLKAAPGGQRNDFFFPIHVVRAAAGSDFSGLPRLGTYFVALRAIARKSDGSPGLLVTTEDAPVFPQQALVPLRAANQGQATPPSAAVSPPPQDSDSQNSGSSPSHLESQGGCPSGNCFRSDDPTFEKLMTDLAKPLAEVDRTRDSFANRTNYNLSEIGPRFVQTCGMHLTNFLPDVVRQSKAAGIPPDFMLAMMVQESGGGCVASRNEADRSSSVGLFQVNSKASRIPRCSVEQKRELAVLRTGSSKGPQCLENPMINLSEAIRILKTQLNNLVTQPGQSAAVNQGRFDRDALVSDGKFNDTGWRLAFSAYNGGGRWVLKAKADLEAFNKKEHTHLSATNWEDLRVFYLRAFVDRNKAEEASFFGNSSADRNPQFARMNLAYTENIVPRDPKYRKSNAPSLAADWHLALNSRGLEASGDE